MISETISGTYIIEDLTLHIKASIGVSLYPEDTTDITELTRYADMAMYEAKKNNDDKYVFYSSLSDDKGV